MPAPEPIPDLLKSANDASARGFALWVTFLTVEIYLAIAAGTTTHKQLLLEGPVKLPLLDVELPLFAFYVFAPLLFVTLHLYVLVQLYLLARTLRLLDDKVQTGLVKKADRANVRAQLDTFVLTQLLIGAPTSPVVRAVLRLAVWLTLLVFPALLLLFMQLRFLPYHNVPTTWLQRVALLLDLGLIWLLWPAIAVGVMPSRRARQWQGGRAALAALCSALALFSILVATVPEEPIELAELRLGWPVHSDPKSNRFWWPTWALSVGKVGLFQRNLVLNDQPLIGLDEDVLAKRRQTLRLRYRDLRHAVLDRADLRKADLTELRLQGASLDGADLQGASLDGAHLQGASLDGADLQGASLYDAHLQGASLAHAHLQGASLDGAQPQGASLDGADLQGASLDGADLQGALLLFAHLQGASLVDAHVWRAYLGMSDTKLADGRNLNTSPTSPDAVQHMIKGVAEAIPDKAHREAALRRLSRLTAAMPLGQEQARAATWEPFTQHGWNEATDDPKLADFLGNLGCERGNAPYVARGLLRRIDSPSEADRPYAPRLAQALLDPSCAGAHGLTTEEVSRLRVVAEHGKAPTAQKTPVDQAVSSSP